MKRVFSIRKHTMGLDMYAFTTDEPVPPAGFKDPKDAQELYYWRKHPNLHGWMEQLYRSKGGKGEFNLATVRLDEADLNTLETIVSNDELPETSGFFFGESCPEEKIRDLEFIQKARKAISEGKTVFYTSWW
jgi:hypothetical protein